MKVIEVDKNKCTACRECELTCSKTFFKEENSELSSIRVVLDENEKVKEVKACNQCGECISVCPTEAIKRTPKGTVIIDKNLCVSCLSCIGFCPTLDMHLNKKTLIPFKCIACGACVKVCAPKAIELVDKTCRDLSPQKV